MHFFVNYDQIFFRYREQHPKTIPQRSSVAERDMVYLIHKEKLFVSLMSERKGP